MLIALFGLEMCCLDQIILTRVEFPVKRTLLDENGYRDTETILDEWNYILGWTGETYKKSMEAIRGLKGASFTLGAMCVSQASSLDMLMYYDARPCSFNGIFGLGGDERLKTYYVFKAFAELRKLGGYVRPAGDCRNVYSAAATDGRTQAILFTYYDHEESEPVKPLRINVRNACKNGPVTVEYYVIDEDRDLALMREEKFTSNDFSAYIDARDFCSYLICIKPF